MPLIDLILQHPDVVKPPNGKGEAAAWCPWHPDKGGRTPNLGINTKKLIAKCFVCGKGGLKKLATAWGIQDPEEDGRRRKAPPSHLSDAAAIELLHQAYLLRDETIAHFQIEPRSSKPKPDRSSRGFWAYPTPIGMRFKAYDRKGPSKYLWDAKTFKNAQQGGSLYGVDDLPAGTTMVYLVNGDPSVWVGWQTSLPVVCAFGEATLTEAAVRPLVELGITQVRIILDLDNAGEDSSLRNVPIIQQAGMEVSAALLPAELGIGGDFCDLYTWHRGDDEAFRQAVKDLPDRDLPGPDPLANTRFFQKDGRFYLRQHTREGETQIQVTNFVARATEEVTVDYGSGEQDRLIILVGRLDSGQHLPEVRISAAKVNGLEWITKEWGYGAIIKAGTGNKDIVREIIQTISVGEGMKRRTVYGHTGWASIDGQWMYLMPGGAIGVEGIDVELPAPYRRYALPTKPENPQEALRASLRFLDVADRHLTLPLLAFTYLAPLQSILRPAFTLWLKASTGSFKSTLTALLLSHFGDFQYNTPPVTWEATARGIERYLFDVKDCLAWIDDFNPRQSEREMSTQNAKADAVLRSLGNLQGRIRMRQDLSLQNTYIPRGMLISTGEILPTGESVIARTMALEFNKNQVHREVLSQAQWDAPLYPHAMAAYVSWLAQRYPDLMRELPEAYGGLRGRALRGDAGEHARAPGAVAALQIAVDLLGQFAVEIGALSEGDATSLSDEAWTQFAELSVQQGRRLAEANVLDQFLDIIDTLLTQEKVIFYEKGVHKTPPIGVDLLGWHDADYVYLDTLAAHNRVARWLRDSGRTMAMSERDLRTALLERGILIKKEDGRLTSRMRMNGRTNHVVVLDVKKLPFSGYFQPELFK